MSPTLPPTDTEGNQPDPGDGTPVWLLFFGIVASIVAVEVHDANIKARRNGR